MSYQLTTVYVAYEVVNEYGKHGGLVMVSQSKEAAEAAAKGRGWWGSDGSVMEKPALVAGPNTVILLESETRYLLDVNIPEDMKARREAALASFNDRNICSACNR